MKKFVMNSLGTMREIENDDEITLMDYFAAKAMQSLILTKKGGEFSIDDITYDAYLFAESMMDARKE